MLKYTFIVAVVAVLVLPGQSQAQGYSVRAIDAKSGGF